MACVISMAVGVTFAVLPSRSGLPGNSGILPPGSQGSLPHHSWWDPRGWFGGNGAPRPQTIAAAGGPQTGRKLTQVAAPPARRVRELTGKRTADTRVFQLSDGRLQAVVSAVPVNYRDAAGRWQPINTTVSRVSQGGYLYGNQSNTFGSLFGRTGASLVRFNAPGGGWLQIGLLGAKVGPPRVAGATVTYVGVAPGVDLSYQVTPTALKERITLASAAAASSLASVSFTITAGGGLILSQRRGGVITVSRDGAGGAPVLTIPAPFMTDASAFSPKVSQQVSVDEAANSMHLKVTPDAGWLHQTSRKFPVVIDPTISIAPTPATAQNTFIEQDTPSVNYDSTWRLSVGTTAGGAVRSLLSFPLDAVPPGTQLDSADLQLYYDQDFGPATDAETIEARQATAPWDAATATWDNASNNVGQLGTNQIVVDDSAADSTSASGAWPSAASSPAVNGAYRYNQDTVSGDTFTWVPPLTEAGSYQVEAHYVASPTAASNAPYTVYYKGGSASYTVNQQSGSGGVWTTLGTQPFAAGTAGKIVLGDGPASATTRVEADAVRLTLPGSVTYDPNANTWDSFPVRNIVQSWLDGASPNYGFVVKAADESALNVGGPRYEASRNAYNGEVATYPQLVLTYGTPGVAVNPPTTIHATGADLSWPAYTDPTPGTNPADDIAEYQVHRSVLQSFVPSADTIVASVPAASTSFTDTTNTPTPPGDGVQGNVFYYMVAVKTKDGTVIPGPVQQAQLPTAGSTTVVIDASGDTTLSSAQPTTNQQQFAGGPYLGVGDNSATYGVTRTVVNYPSMASAGIPADATVTNAELRLWGWYNVWDSGNAVYEAHALTQSFDPATATWDNASAGTAWAAPGGAYDGTTLGTVTNLVSDPGRDEWPVTDAVQNWVSTPADEHGLLVKESGETVNDSQERELFLNSSAVEPRLRPELLVTYIEPTSQDTYYVPDLPEPMTASTTYTVPVTITNTTDETWSAADWVLSYHWMLPDGTEVSTDQNQAQTPLPADMAPMSVATINVTLTTPDNTGSGSTRTGYTLEWDLYNKTAGAWLSDGGGTASPTANSAGATQLGGAAKASTAASQAAAPMAQGNNTIASLPQGVSVQQPTSDKLGLEKFYQYTGVSTGSGTALLNNAYAGNTVWSYNAFSNPSRGFATFVRVAYNSMDTSNSSMGFGWSLQTSTLMRLGTPLDFDPRPNPSVVTLTDGDGTSHQFVFNPTTGQWQAAPGLNLYLQQIATCTPNGKDPVAKAWVLTRPDRTQFFFDCQGYQTAVVDNNGNEADFTYNQRNSNNQPVKFLSYITDPSGRQTLTLSYYKKGDNYNFIDANGNVVSDTNLTDPQIIDQVKSITDISGRTITFLYTVQGLMAQMTDGDGSPLAKVFKFGYDMTQGNKNVKLVAVTDPRGNTTHLAYYTAPQDPKFKWSLNTITDRRDGNTSFAYTQTGGGTIQTTATDPNNHASTYQLDANGRPTQSTNALGQVTKLAWDGDNNVTSLTENNKAVTTWTYDQNTGYPLTMKDAQANHDGTAPTTWTYQTGLNGHIADLTAELTPQQRLWTFGYDANGNLTSVTDPDGNATSTAGDFTTNYAYDAIGQLQTAKDANGNTTTYSSYDPNGFPQTITDPLGKATSFTYDARGYVTSVMDALNHTTTQAYDVFGRPGQNVVPQDQAGGVFVTTPAPVYDGNDNITQATAPNGAITTTSYDPNDEKTAQLLPPDTATSPQRKSTYTYDAAGNLTSMTEPNGNLPSPVSSFTTTYAYDAINELTSITDAADNTTTFGYDDVGNKTSTTDPLGNPPTKYAYDLDHRQTSITDPAGFTTSKKYDLDGLVTSVTDQNDSTTLLTLDPRGKVTQMKVPHDTTGGNIVYDTTQYAYDQVGNLTKTITPRGVASGVANAFTQQTQYDADNRVKAQLSAYDPNDPVYNTPAETDYTYDAAGRLSLVSAPPSGGQTIRNVTNYSYFDNGWTKSSTDPFGITTSYGYNPLGEQTSRTITSGGGAASRTLSWRYFPDGTTASQADAGVPTGLATELADDSDFNNTTFTGTWTPSSAGTGFQGTGYHTHAVGAGTDAFTWNLNIPEDGNYTVYVKYPAISGAAANAAFKVSFNGGSSTVPVNQTQNAGTWVSLGKFAFTRAGTGQSVTLTENPGGTVVADAVQIVRDNGGDPNTANHNFSYTYDSNGNLTEITDTSPGAAINDYQVSYDGLNRVTQIGELASGVTKHTTTFGYDAASNLTSRTHDGAPSSYTYDPRSLLSTETDAQSATDPSPQVTTFTFNPVGQLASEVKPNGNTVTDSYFADWSLQHSIETKPDGTTVDEHTYTYNPNGGKSQDIEKLMSADNSGSYLTHTLAYAYDPQDRISQVTKDGTVTESYLHDANANVTTQTVNGTTTTFNFDRNRLLTAVTNGVTADYNYDPFGRLDTVTSGGQVQQRNTYDGFDHIIEHQQLNTGGTLDTTDYAFDPLDRMTSQTTAAGTPSAATTDYAYLGLSTELISELQNGKQTKSYSYTPGGQRLSQTIDNSNGTQTPGYYTYNDHSDVEAVTGQNGNTSATYGYTAYGQPDTGQFTGADKNNITPGTTTQPFSAYRYNAMRWDSSSAQYDMGFRNYDPALNQFLSRDMFNGALADMALDTDPFTGNRYTFGGGNPVSNIELTGHRFCNASNITPDCDAVRGTSSSDVTLLSANPTPSKDYTTLHNDVRDRATEQIMQMVQFRAHGDPQNVNWECPVDKGKHGSKVGRVDICYEEGNTVYIWEIKSLGQSKQGQEDLQIYAKAMQNDARYAGKKIVNGFNLASPFVGVSRKDELYIAGSDPKYQGVISYFKIEDPPPLDPPLQREEEQQPNETTKTNVPPRPVPGMSPLPAVSLKPPAYLCISVAGNAVFIPGCNASG